MTIIKEIGIEVDIDDIIDDCGAQEVLKKVDVDDIINFIADQDMDDFAESIGAKIDNFSEDALKMIACQLSDETAATLINAIKIYHRDLA